ncbi:hypothetical protein [Komagataeibacter melomenusus]|uniref:hypothetical protein n=1 Tax=Komagataeibacter melomenusus TaxID=2766578 RepID=UPI00155700F6|nr:hypothetical protein [Komagataeibacter melomenusus]
MWERGSWASACARGCGDKRLFKNQKFLGAAFFQKGGVLSKLFEKSFAKNFFMIAGHS